MISPIAARPATKVIAATTYTHTGNFFNLSCFKIRKTKMKTIDETASPPKTRPIVKIILGVVMIEHCIVEIAPAISFGNFNMESHYNGCVSRNINTS